MKKILVTLLLLAVFFTCFQSCTKLSDEEIMQDYIFCADSNVSFTNNVLPIIQRDCTPCHSGNSAEAGVELDDYPEIQSLAFSGDLMKTVKHESGILPMPQGKPKWNDCKISTVQKWIDEGMQDN